MHYPIIWIIFIFIKTSITVFIVIITPFTGIGCIRKYAVSAVEIVVGCAVSCGAFALAGGVGYPICFKFCTAGQTAANIVYVGYGAI
jgi:hypothetical protein